MYLDNTYLMYCSPGTYLEIKSIWYPYDDSEYYIKRGIAKGKVIYVDDETSEGMTINSEAEIDGEVKEFTTILDYHQCKYICGNPKEKTPKQKNTHIK